MLMVIMIKVKYGKLKQKEPLKKSVKEREKFNLWIQIAEDIHPSFLHHSKQLGVVLNKTTQCSNIS